MDKFSHNRSNNESKIGCDTSAFAPTLFSNYVDDSHAMSERVQSLADAVYREFERLIKTYDEGVVKELMPLIVAILESLDSACRDKQQAEVDNELMREDNDQLLSQYEKERQLRRIADQKYLVLEDCMEDERKQLQGRLESYQSIVRMFEIKLKNSQDQIARLDDKEQETKKEFSKLHDRYTDLLKAHMDFKERVKTLVSTNTTPSQDIIDAPGFNSDFTLPRNFKFTSPLKGQQSQKGNDQVLDEEDELERGGSSFIKKFHSTKETGDVPGSLKSEIESEFRQKDEDKTDGCVESEQECINRSESIRKPSLSSDSEQGTGQKRLISIDDNLRRSLIGEMDKLHLTFCDEDGNYETQMRPSVYEEMMDNEDNSELHIVGDNHAIEEMQQQDDRGDVDDNDDVDESNYMNGDDSGNDGYNFYGVSKEIENLIMENNELLETKHALNIVKDDLIARVDELTGEKEILKDELNTVTNMKERLKVRMNELEEELKKMREELEKERNKDASSSHGEGEEDNLAPGTRKRFTRMEMARVLMERNQYKEKLMELQEAVRWAEMVRATRDHPEFGGGAEKKKSSVWNFFSSLFSGPSKSNASYLDCSTADQTIYYDASSLTTTPLSNNNRNNINNSLTIGLNSIRERGIGMNERAEEDVSFGDVDAPFRRVPPRLLSEESRVHACGWSLPPKFQLHRPLVAATGQSELGLSSVPKSSVPMPVFCKPLLEEDPNIKILCAAAISWKGGKTKDGGNAIGTSVFYSTTGEAGGGCNVSRSQVVSHNKTVITSTPLKNVMTSSSAVSSSTTAVFSTPPTSFTLVKSDVVEDEVEKLNEEILSHEKDIKEGFDLTSDDGQPDLSPAHVWICVDDKTGSHVIVVDAANGGEVLEKFHVCLPNLHCITGVPGTTGNDYRDIDTTTTPPLISSSTPPLQASNLSSPLVTGSSHVTYVDLKDLTNCDSNRGQVTGLTIPNSRSVNSFADEELEKSYNIQSTVWMGNISGGLYIYSASSRMRLYSVKLRDSILAICHTEGRVFVTLSDGTVSCFLRNSDGYWNMNGYYNIVLTEPTVAVRSALVVAKKFLWFSAANTIFVLDPITYSMETRFNAHPRKENHVRQMAWMGEGVWVGLRNDSTLRLYHAYTHQHLQDVDIEPCISKFIGSSKLGFSLVQISCLMASLDRLWIGTGNGVVLSIPISESYQPGVLTSVNAALVESTSTSLGVATSSTPSSFGGSRMPGGIVRVYKGTRNDEVYPGSFIPYCSIAQVQLSFHGHKEAVKFLAAIPGHEKKNAMMKTSNKHVETYRKYSLPLPSSTSLSLTPQSSSAPSDQLDATSSSSQAKCLWVMCGGEGCADFRKGEELSSDVDGANDSTEAYMTHDEHSLPKSDKSHMIMWQLFMP